MPGAEASRYDGKPMVRLLDSYVLDAIGALDEASLQSLAAMSEKLASVLGVKYGPWQQMIEQSMHMPLGTRQGVQMLWEQHVQAMLAVGRNPDPLAFAYELVDTRLS